MTIEEMNTKRTELGYSYKDIARLADMPLSTVQKILGGVTKAPRRESLIKIQQVLVTQTGYAAKSSSSGPLILQESSPAYGTPKKEQGNYTVDDYYALPDDQRVELIDGVFYDMSAPTSPHQFIGGSIHSQLLNYRSAHKGPCLPMVSPVDVQLDCDNKTMIQPDVLIVCDRSKITKKGIFGAPDFIVEVLSPSTRKKDMTLKMTKYLNAGVREYWIIDPDKRKVVTYNLTTMDIPVIYGFTEDIPVGIWDNKCMVNLSEVDEILNELSM
ncbi:MAG: Uma2 family endonuclease [Lachnospiraceae bacterium]|nr:Uma2 family endonuclease [Lachnospiraceae bacterium]